MISVVIPVLNERDNIESLIPEIYSVLDGLDFEVVVVDGDSSDGTPETVRKLQVDYGKLRYMRQSGRGYANALVDGMRAAAGEYVVTMDAENHDPAGIKPMLSKISEGFDVVISSRYVKGSRVDLQKHRLLISMTANVLSRMMMGLRAKDTSSGFRAYRGKVLKTAVESDTRTNYFSVQVEVLDRISQAGGRITELPMHYRHRDKGESKFGLVPAIRDTFNLLAISSGRLRQKLCRSLQ
ncbi:MAG: glycosyltransferase [Candidatus Altiarchaeota archaeon]